WAIAAILAVAAVTAFVSQITRRPTTGTVLRASLVVGKGVEVLPFDLAFSPDGRNLAFVARSGNGQALWVRAADSIQAQPLPGTDDARYPFWSPDGRRLGFFAGTKLRIAELAGGSRLSVADGPVGR